MVERVRVYFLSFFLVFPSFCCVFIIVLDTIRYGVVSETEWYLLVYVECFRRFFVCFFFLNVLVVLDSWTLRFGTAVVAFDESSSERRLGAGWK